MTFTESNTVEQMILDAAMKFGGKQASMAREDAPPNPTVPTRFSTI